jgi:hypothetical protein
VLNDGTVEFTNQVVEFQNIAGLIDDAGVLTNLSGEITLSNWRPIAGRVEVHAEAFPFRIPQELELELDVDAVLTAGRDSVRLGGQLAVVDGRYFRAFNLFDDVIKPERISEKAPPIWEQVPLLAQTQLNLQIKTEQFEVRNNIADIALRGDLLLRGTAAKPNISGQIRVERGEFKIPTFRAQFTRTSGTLTFQEFRDVPDETPTIDLRSESDYRDTRGQEHLVTLRLEGTLSNLNWDVSTSTGLDKASTITLIWTGRSAEETRALLGDDPAATRGIDNTSNDSTVDSEGAAAVDEAVKDIAADFISTLLEDPLRNITNLDVFRIEVGTASVGVHTEKRLGRAGVWDVDWERTLRGQTLKSSLRYRLTNRTSGEVTGLMKTFTEDEVAEEDRREFRAKATYRRIIQ